jgi:hypothetical protein
MTVRHHDMGRALRRRLLVALEGRVVEERVDQDGRPLQVDAEGRMAEPGDLHGVPSRFSSIVPAMIAPHPLFRNA